MQQKIEKKPVLSCSSSGHITRLTQSIFGLLISMLRTNTLAYFAAKSVTKKKKFYNILTRCWQAAFKAFVPVDASWNKKIKRVVVPSYESLAFFISNFWWTFYRLLRQYDNTYTKYTKRLVSRINPCLLLKIILYNTWKLQLNKVNQMKLYTKDN